MTPLSSEEISWARSLLPGLKEFSECSFVRFVKLRDGLFSLQFILQRGAEVEILKEYQLTPE